MYTADKMSDIPDYLLQTDIPVQGSLINVDFYTKYFEVQKFPTTSKQVQSFQN